MIFYLFSKISQFDRKTSNNYGLFGTQRAEKVNQNPYNAADSRISFNRIAILLRKSLTHYILHSLFLIKRVIGQKVLIDPMIAKDRWQNLYNTLILPAVFFRTPQFIQDIVSEVTGYHTFTTQCVNDISPMFIFLPAYLSRRPSIPSPL